MAQSRRSTHNNGKVGNRHRFGLSSGKDNDGNEGYVFVGKTFDYLITSGAESVVKLLQDPQIDRHNLQAVDIAKFIISDNKRCLKAY